MKDELITFETAKLAKELGFDLKTNFYYDEKGVLDNGDGDIEYIELNHNKYNLYSAPTNKLLEDWLKQNNKVL